jgi:nitroreductase
MTEPISLLEGMATTRAIRRYRPEPIPEEDLSTILWHASRAPSGSNRQAFRFLVLRDGPKAAKAKAALGEACRAGWGQKRGEDGYDRGSGGPAGNTAQSTPKARMAATMQHFVDHFEETPVVVLVCLDRYRDTNPVEGASVYPACQNLLLAARALGYGGVLMSWHLFALDELREILGIPEGVFIAATIPLGRPVGGHGPVRRRPVGEVVFDDAWGEPARWAVDPPGTRFTRPGPGT